LILLRFKGFLWTKHYCCNL